MLNVERCFFWQTLVCLTFPLIEPIIIVNFGVTKWILLLEEEENIKLIQLSQLFDVSSLKLSRE